MSMFGGWIACEKVKIGSWVVAFLDFEAFVGQPFSYILFNIAGRHEYVADADLFQRSEQIVNVLEDRF